MDFGTMALIPVLHFSIVIGGNARKVGTRTSMATISMLGLVTTFTLLKMGRIHV